MAPEKFKAIQEQLCHLHKHVTQGKMMSSPAIHYQGKVFAFFSRKGTMVFKLGNAYPVEGLKIRTEIFSPFKSKRPLSGWHEVSWEDNAHWLRMGELALSLAEKNFKLCNCPIV